MSIFLKRISMPAEQQSAPLPSHLFRTLDPRLPSNRLILIFAAAVTLGVGFYRLAAGTALADTAIQAGGAGVFAVLAWAIGRELDPDHNLPAPVAAVLAVLALLSWGMPNLLLAGAVIPLLRIVNRTTGLPARISDSLGVVALVGLVAALDGLWVIGPVMAAAFLLNALLAQPDRPGGYVFAALTLLVTVAAAAVFPPAEWTLRIDPALGAGVMMVGLAYLAVVLRDPPQLKSVGDWTDEPLNRNRVLAGQLLALVAALAILLWDHRLGLVALSPLWAAMIGVIARRAVQIVRP